MILSRTPALFAAAGVSWAIAQGVEPDMGTKAATRLRHVLAAPGREACAAVFFLLTGVFVILACLSAARVHRTGPGARVIDVGLALTAVSACWHAAGRGAFDLLFVTLTDHGVDRATALHLIDASPGAAWIPFDLTFFLTLLGPVVLAAGLWRARLTNVVPLVLWVVGVVAYGVTEFRVKPFEVAEIAVMTVALALIGLALTRDAEAPARVSASPAPVAA